MAKLTGEQNSSKAGFTKVMYWVRTASKSRPRSLISRGTNRVFFILLTWNHEKSPLTSPGQSGIGVCVHEKLHVEKVAYLGKVKDQNALE